MTQLYPLGNDYSAGQAEPGYVRWRPSSPQEGDSVPALTAASSPTPHFSESQQPFNTRANRAGLLGGLHELWNGRRSQGTLTNDLERVTPPLTASAVWELRQRLEGGWPSRVISDFLLPDSINTWLSL